MRLTYEKNFPGIIYYLGAILQIFGVVVLFPIMASYYYNEGLEIAFLTPSVVSLSLGALLQKLGKNNEIGYPEAMVLGFLTLSVASLIASLPYLISGMFSCDLNGFINSYFEAASGLTTTGLSAISDVDALPRSILLWRSLTQWIGGLGIVMLFLAILGVPGISASYLYKGEAKSERLEPSIIHTARKLAKIYILITILCTCCYIIADVPPFIALVHALSTVSTGGFSSASSSFTNFPLFAKIFAMLFMICGATSFTIHHKIIKGNFRGAIQSVELRVMLFMLLLATFLLYPFTKSIGDAAFQATSALTTTGFFTINIKHTHPLPKLLLLFFMIVGGCSLSTAGGLKIVRFISLVKGGIWFLRKSMLPRSAIIPIKISKKVLGESEMIMIMCYFFIYIAMLTLGALTLTFYGYEPFEAIFESASAIGTVGLSMGIATQSLPIIPKVVLIAEMFVGRLEIIPLFITVAYFVKK